MNLFGNIIYQSEINGMANFETFPNAMLMLFRWTFTKSNPKL